MTSPLLSQSTSPDHWHLAGLELLESGRVQDAVACLRRALDLDPANAAVWNDLGVVLEAVGNRTDAVYCYRRALRARPGFEQPRRNLIALALQAAACAPLPRPARARAATAVAR